MLSKFKKLFLSLFVILSSAAYVAWQKNDNQNHPVTLSFDSTSSSQPSSIGNSSSNNNSNNSAGNSSGNSSNNTPSNPSNPGQTYSDGQYTGQAADAYYGNVQVKAIIQNGKLTDIQFLDYPQDRSHSVRINQAALPILKQEAIQTQSAQVQIVSGATDTSQAFQESLGSALSQAIT